MAMPAADAPPAAGLRDRILRGLGWKVISQIVLLASKFVVAIVLARLLAPDDFGLAGMVLVFASLAYVFSDLALGAALVQRRVLSDADRSTVFWTSFAAGLAFTGLGVALSGPIAALYGEPAVQPLFAALSLSFLVNALGTTQKALLTRELDFRRLELRMILATLIAAAVGIALAAYGFGAWAIIAQQLTIAGVSTVLLWAVSPWRPRFTFSRASLRDLSGFSANVFATRMLFYVSRNADNFLIGRFLGTAALGLYALAYNVMLTPFSQIAGPIQEVLFPAFSRMQDDVRRLGSIWLRVNRMVAAFAMPALLGLMIVASDFVHVALGERWEDAVPLIQILAWVGLLQSLQRMNSSVLQARDRTSTLLVFSVVAVSANVVAFVVGLRWGIVGVAVCYAVSNTALQPMYTWLTARTVGLSLLDCARNLSGVAQASLLMAGLVFGCRLLLVEEDVGPAARLTLLVAIGTASFVGFALWRAPALVADLRSLRRAPAPNAAALHEPSRS
jgi:O-antigen/teichoic acid export membrane protein